MDRSNMLLTQIQTFMMLRIWSGLIPQTILVQMLVSCLLDQY